MQNIISLEWLVTSQIYSQVVWNIEEHKIDSGNTVNIFAVMTSLFEGQVRIGAMTQMIFNPDLMIKL